MDDPAGPALIRLPPTPFAVDRRSGPVSSAYFGTTRGKFRMTYPFSEQATVVSGELLLTDESTGQTTRYKAGDSWFVTKGTPVLWEVLSDSFVKHYYAVA
ncbi:hypothetical protein D9M68_119520 [compost metagenome]